MACSGVYIEHLKDDGVKIGVTDYHVSEFGDSDWEWSLYLDKSNKTILINKLKEEFKVDYSLKEMIVAKFTNTLDTIGFVKYLDEHNIKYIIERTWW